MEKLTVKIAGVPYTIVTDSDVDYAASLAVLADEKISEIMKSGRVSPSQATVLALLDYADEAAKAKENIEMMRGQLKEYLADAAAAKSERDMLRRELQKLQKNPSEA